MYGRGWNRKITIDKYGAKESLVFHGQVILYNLHASHNRIMYQNYWFHYPSLRYIQRILMIKQFFNSVKNWIGVNQLICINQRNWNWVVGQSIIGNYRQWLVLWQHGLPWISFYCVNWSQLMATIGQFNQSIQFSKKMRWGWKNWIGVNQLICINQCNWNWVVGQSIIGNYHDDLSSINFYIFRYKIIF